MNVKKNKIEKWTFLILVLGIFLTLQGKALAVPSIVPETTITIIGTGGSVGFDATLTYQVWSWTDSDIPVGMTLLPGQAGYDYLLTSNVTATVSATDTSLVEIHGFTLAATSFLSGGIIEPSNAIDAGSPSGVPLVTFGTTTDPLESGESLHVFGISTFLPYLGQAGIFDSGLTALTGFGQVAVPLIGGAEVSLVRGVPEPGTLLLVGTGILLVGGASKGRKRLFRKKNDHIIENKLN